jgi:hypothetical protein
MPNIKKRIAPFFVIGLFSSTLAFAEIQVDANGNLIEFTHATMSDGVKIALAVGYPMSFDPEDLTKKWPTILEMSGYQAATRPASHQYYEGLYITVNASLRGTGASQGAFSLFSDRSTRDGYEIIEEWIVKQTWSNGKVGIHGHSWPGLTGFRVAATNPPHLNAVVVSGLFDDAFRGLSQIGGIRNIGFPLRWTSNFQRPDGVFGSDEAAIENRNLDESEASELRKSRTLRGTDVQSQPGTIRSIAKDIRVPIFLLHAYQDQQTGPSGAWIFDQIPDDVPKRLLLSNGHHGMPVRFLAQRRAWFDFWLRDERSDLMPDIDKPDSRVEAYFEVENRAAAPNPPLISSDFPLPETEWTRYYLNPANELSTSAPAADIDSQTDTYKVVSEAVDETMDRVEYRLEFDEPTAICGPIVMSLWASCTGVDTDFFVTLSDIAPDGRVRALQRGMLRASLRSIDDQMSTWMDNDGEKVLVRPYYTFENAQPLEPGTPHQFEIEVFPVGHVFREGHELSLSISKPPLSDPVPYPKGKKTKIKSGSYKYESKQPDGTVTIHRSSEYPSSVLLPLLPGVPAIAEKRPTSIDQMWNQSGKIAQ